MLLVPAATNTINTIASCKYIDKESNWAEILTDLVIVTF